MCDLKNRNDRTPSLRRSFGTLVEWEETPTAIVVQLMRHKPGATAEKSYRERPLDLLRMWHSRRVASGVFRLICETLRYTIKP